MKKKSAAKLLAGVVLALGFLAGNISPVAADDGWQQADNVWDRDYLNGRKKHCRQLWQGATNVAKACFQPYGEHIWVADLERDGEPVAMKWQFRKNGSIIRRGTIYDRWGADAGWTHRNKSFAENQDFRFKTCLVASIKRHAIGRCTEYTGWFDT